MNGLSVPVTARSLNAPSSSVAEGVTEDGAMNDSANIPAARDSTTPPGRLLASTSGLYIAVVTEPSVFGLYLRNSSPWKGCRSKY